MILRLVARYLVTIGCILIGAVYVAAEASNQAVCLPHSESPIDNEFPDKHRNVSRESSFTYQQFPASGSLETAWYVAFDHSTRNALFITGAHFKPSPAHDWIQVLGRASISEIFVPYASGNPRFYDLSVHSKGLVEANKADTGPCGHMIGRDNSVVREVVDKGPLWKNDDRVWRGQKLLLWGTVDVANYNYIIRYEFHDDGTIKFRVAGTAVNLPWAPNEAHTHNVLWRIDVNLNGPDGDSVNVLRHLEAVGDIEWRNESAPFNGGFEGAVDFVATEFTQVQVVDSELQNAAGKTSAYDIRPLYRGVVRHNERFMRNDFWATVQSPLEQEFEDVGVYTDGESIEDADVVVWHITSLLHVPRSEDGGVALAMWGGFDMRPRDLFDGTPFYR